MGDGLDSPQTVMTTRAPAKKNPAKLVCLGNLEFKHQWVAIFSVWKKKTKAF